MPSPLRVAIIGGGPGGLTLARILQETTSGDELQLTVYERDASRTARSQGGSLDLHEESGLRAIKAAGLVEQFRKLARPEGDQMKLYDLHGTLRYDEEQLEKMGSEGEELKGRPEIDRTELRDLLIDSIRAETIKWGHHLVSSKPVADSPTNSYELTFASGETAIVDLVVGADGAWSKIRPLLNPNAIPQFTGLCGFDFTICDVDKIHPQLAEMTGNGLAFFPSNGRAVVAQRNNHSKIKVYVYVKRAIDEDKWIDTYKGIPAQELKKISIDLFKGYDDKILDFIRAADDNIAINKLYAIPLKEYHHPPHPSLVLLGDAAHVMPPFAGEGVNLAMADATDLSSHISRYLASRSTLKPLTLSQVLKTHSEQMFKRAKPFGAESLGNQEIFFGDDGIEFMSRVMVFSKGVTLSAIANFVPWYIWRMIRRTLRNLVQLIWRS